MMTGEKLRLLFKPVICINSDRKMASSWLIKMLLNKYFNIVFISFFRIRSESEI